MTPVLTSAPTMTNRPAKNTSVGHSTSLATSLGVQPGQRQQHQPADHRHHRRLQVQHGVQDERGGDQRRARPG